MSVAIRVAAPVTTKLPVTSAISPIRIGLPVAAPAELEVEPELEVDELDGLPPPQAARSMPPSRTSRMFRGERIVTALHICGLLNLRLDQHQVAGALGEVNL